MLRLLLCFLSSTAFAQVSTTTPQPEINGDLGIQLLQPNANNGGAINCTSTSNSNCVPLNANACDESPARNIQVLIGRGKATPVAGQDLYVWMQGSSATCFYDSNQSTNKVSGMPYTLQVSDYLVLNTLGTLEFPTDLNNITFNTSTVLNASAINACGDTGVDKVIRICIGLNTNGDGLVQRTTNNLGVLVDPTSYIQLLVDTLPPPQASIESVKELDGRIQAKVTLASGSASDITTWKIWAKALSDANEDPGTCDTWAEGSYNIGTLTATESGGHVTVSGTNGTRYALCAFAVDDLGNQGPASALAYATPNDECDFIECLPGKNLESGYCGQHSASLFIAASVGVMLAYVRQRMRGQA